jgi:hypothetical protein
MARDDGVAAWTFDLSHWGACGQGATESDAVANLLAFTGESSAVVVEWIDGDEGAFERDFVTVRQDELAETLRILSDARTETIELVEQASDAELDRIDPDRTLPNWADWTSARRLAWHIADTESRYYLPRMGLPAKPRGPDLVTELRSSAIHVRSTLTELDSIAVASTEGEVWTSVKLLRRLAWHERVELVPLRRLLARS